MQSNPRVFARPGKENAQFWLDRNKDRDACATIERRGKEKTMSPKVPKKRSTRVDA